MNSLERSQLWFHLLRKTRGLIPPSIHCAWMCRQVARIRRERGLRDSGRVRRADCVIVSHPKSGRTWLRTQLSRLFQERYSLRPDQLLEFDNFHNQNPTIPVIFFTDDNYVNDVTAQPGTKVDYRDKRVVLLVRNPADVAVSLYHQHARRTSPLKKALNDIPAEVGTLPMFDYVMEHPQGLRHVVDFMNAWERNLDAFESLLLIYYEQMQAQPVQTLQEISAFLGLDFSAGEISRAVDFASVDNLRKLGAGDFFKNHRLRPTDPNNPDSNKVRRAKVNGYRDDFTAEQVSRIDAYVREKLAPSFGYPLDDDQVSRLKISAAS